MSLDELTARQRTTGDEIKRIAVNYKTDTATRKTAEYLNTRLINLNQLWEEFEKIDNQIRINYGSHLDHAYFANDYYEGIRIGYDNLNQDILRRLQELSSEQLIQIDSEQEKIRKINNPDATVKPQSRSKEAFDRGAAANIEQQSTLEDNNTGALSKSIKADSSAIICQQTSLMQGLRNMLNHIILQAQPHSAHFYEIKIKAIEHHWEKIQHFHSKILEDLDDSYLSDTMGEYFDLEELTHEKLVNLYEGFSHSQRKPEANTNSLAAELSPRSSMKLPKVELPKFDGDYLKWRQFCDLFSELIHNQPLPACQKMWYLKSILIGEAEKLVQHLTITEANYATAWKLINDRYENPRLLITALLNKILSQPTAITESASAIKTIHDTTQECLLALGNLGVNIENWDPLLLHILMKKLDRATHTLWEQSLSKPRSLQSLKEFLQFLENRFQSLEAMGNTNRAEGKRVHTQRALTTSVKAGCPSCSSNHQLFACPKFLQLSPSNRVSLVKRINACLNCLRSGHIISSCPSRGCLKCGKKHNTLLRFEPTKTKAVASRTNQVPTSEVQPSTSISTTSSPNRVTTEPSISLTAKSTPTTKNYVLLSTAIVKLTNKTGTSIECRAILDSGSQLNFITQKLVKKLGLIGTPELMNIEGIGLRKQQAQKRVNMLLESRINGFSTTLEAHILPRIISPQPSQLIDITSWPIPANIQLADAQFNQPGTIDLLIGAELYYSILSVGQIKLGKTLPTMQNTVFGWTIAGRSQHTPLTQAICGICSEDEALQQQMEKFWMLDDAEQSAKAFTTAERQCEAHFVQNTRRNKEGRFTVKLPFKVEAQTLGESKNIAFQRFVALEKRLDTNEELKKQYVKFMDEYIELGHMEEAKFAAELAARLKRDLKIKNAPIYLWTDSEIVLAWINSSSSSYQTFVANRIAVIQQLTISEQWRHVRSKDNPADILSRGMAPEKLGNSVIWFYGPTFLHGAETLWPSPYTKKMVANDSERRRAHVAASSTEIKEAETILSHINHRNSFQKVQRIMAYVLRFIRHTRKLNRDPAATFALNAEELDKGQAMVVRLMQQEGFNEDLSHLQSFGEVSKNSAISSLTPFIDEDNIVRFGGRLEESNLTYQAKHPMLLPYGHHLTKCLLNDIHKEKLHVGPQTLLAITRQKFWPLKGKTLARSVVQHCVQCAKSKPKLLTQLMGNLPADRVQPARPFVNAGVDFCGPIYTHFKIRGKRPQKSYITVFCCFSTKATHLEIVSDLSTQGFLGALRRFMARRGHCRTIYCDNATNFVGAKNQLQEVKYMIESSHSRNEIIEACSSKTIDFRFIPPRAPHFGGLWEAAVKSAKHLLQRTLASDSLTYETVVVEIEAVLNSRPITPMSSDPNDLTALTPGHFLIGEPLTSTIDPKAKSTNANLITRWKRVSHIKNEFWRRWTMEYLSQLQHRYKWKQRCQNVQPGTMVLVKEDNIPALKWPLGRIINTIRGNDGLVRVADIRTSSGIIRRPIHRLAPLPIEAESSDEPATQNETEDQKITTTITSSNISQPTRDEPTTSYEPTQPRRNDNPRKKQRRSVGSAIVTFLLTCLMLPSINSSPIETKPFTHHPGIYFENLGAANIVANEWKLVVFYDMTAYWKEFALLQNCTRVLEELCQRINEREQCLGIIAHIKQLQLELDTNNILLSEPSNSNRSKRGTINVVCDKNTTQYVIEGTGILKIRDRCLIKQPLVSIQGHSVYPTNTRSSYIPTSNLTEFIIAAKKNPTLDNIVQHQSYTSEIDSIKGELSQFKKSLSLNTLSTDVHQFSVGYVSVILIIVIIEICAIRSRKMTPVPTP